MVNSVKRLKSAELESQYTTLLHGILGRVPFLKLLSLQKVTASDRTFACPGYVAEASVSASIWTLLIHQKTTGYPRETRTAALELEHQLREFPAGQRCYGMLFAPFISDESARICTEAGIGYADLAGNARISFDQIFIETRSIGKSPAEKRGDRPLFTPRAARVLRILLHGPLREWKVQDLAAASGASLGWVSAVRQQLLAREWAAETRNGLKATKPNAILDAWARADEWKKRTETIEYSSLLAGDGLDLADKLQRALPAGSLAFTQWFAASLRHPYTLSPVITAYIKTPPSDPVIEEALLARRVPSGGRLRLLIPRDEGVFEPAQFVKGFSLAPDIQIYLDLLQAGERGEEQAAELRKWPDFAGGWA